MVKKYIRIDEMKKNILLIVFSLLSIGTIYSQTKFTIEAPGQVIAGQKFKIVFVLENGDGEDLKLPEFEGMTILYGPARSQSSQFSFINGKMTLFFAPYSKYCSINFLAFSESNGLFITTS